MVWFWRQRNLRRAISNPSVLRGPNDDPNLTDEQLLVQRAQWFEAYTSQLNVFAKVSDRPYSCPCCGHLTLSERGGYEICGECGWEDDGQDDHDAEVVRGGPNGRQSLAEARATYVSEGGAAQKHEPPAIPS